MKNTIYLSLIIIFCSIASCNKDNKIIQPFCKIIEIEEFDSKNNLNNYTSYIEYNSDKKPVKLTSYRASNKVATSIIKYATNFYSISYYDSAMTLTKINNYYLFNNGNVKQIIYNYFDPFFTNDTTYYTYDAEGYLYSSEDASSLASDVIKSETRYKYVGGNCTEVWNYIILRGNDMVLDSAIKLKYTYYDRVAGTYNNSLFLNTQLGKPNKSLLKSLAVFGKIAPTLYNYSKYDFDEKGNVIVVYSSYNEDFTDPSGKTKLFWNCN